MKKLKITITINFRSMVLKYTFSLTFFESAVDFTISLYNKNAGFAIFCKTLLSKPVRRCFFVIKLFLKNFAKFKEKLYVDVTVASDISGYPCVGYLLQGPH